MELIMAHDRVQLQEPLPELGLLKGDVGEVISSWFYPNMAYEVEFEVKEQSGLLRVLLLEWQVALAQSP